MNTETKIGEQLFNHACSQAAAKFNITYLDEQLTAGNYDPFNDDEQLTWIFDLVVHYSNAPMDIDGGADSEGNFTGNYMLAYVYENINVLLGDDKEQFRETGEEHQKIQRFNAFCAKTMGWRQGTGRYADGYYFLPPGGLSGQYKGQVEDYNPYDDMSDIQPVLDILVDTKDLTIRPQDVINDGHLQAARDAISKFINDWDEYDRNMEEQSNMMWDNLMSRQVEESKTVPEALNNLADAIDASTLNMLDDAIDAATTPPPPITNFRYGLGYPDVNEEQEKFNAQCREIVFEHARGQGGSLMLPQAYDPYYNANETINVFEIVLQYLPPTIKFLVTGRTEHDYPEDIDVFEKMKQLIRLYGTDEYMLPPAVAFNKMCATLVEGYNIYDCNANDLFDPYNKIEHLAPILPIVASRVNENFTLGELMYDLPREDSYNMNLFDNMRHYVQRHGQTLIDILDE